MADEPTHLTTDNYNLTYPTDNAPIDTAGDFENLAVGIDNALIGINVDTAGKTDFSYASGPINLFGTGRPDGLGDPSVSYNNTALTAPTGSTYVWTGDDPDAVFGARAWRKAENEWRCTEGFLRQEIIDANSAALKPSCVERLHVIPHRYPDRTVWQIPNLAFCTTVTRREPWIEGSEVTPEKGLSLAASGVSSGTVFGSEWWATDLHIQGEFVCPPTYGSVHGNNLLQGHLVVDHHQYIQWPSELLPGATFVATRAVEELRELIEAEADPEKLQQLRDELAALTGTRPGDYKAFGDAS